jgi:hypothetical protein
MISKDTRNMIKRFADMLIEKKSIHSVEEIKNKMDTYLELVKKIESMDSLPRKHKHGN